MNILRRKKPEPEPEIDPTERLIRAVQEVNAAWHAHPEGTFKIKPWIDWPTRQVTVVAAISPERIWPPLDLDEAYESQEHMEDTAPVTGKY